jgi:gliding motility-associated-like protein
MKKIYCVLVLCVACLSGIAQQGKDGAGVVNAAGTIVNSYTTLSADVSAGSLTMSVTSATSLNAGDLIMVIQMQGATANVIPAGAPWFDPNSSVPGDTSYGRVLALNGAGNNELAEINSVAGTTLTFNCALKNSYTVSGKTQIVKVPRYTSLSIGATGIITCPHWDRTLGYGGVIAIEVHGNTTIASGGRIDASGLGFRGGALWNKTASAAGGGQWGCLYRDQGGNKGESIAGDTTLYGTAYNSKFSKGSIANGGGGGNSINAGGGGGANAGLPGLWTSNGNPDNSQAAYTTCWNLEYAGFATSTSSGGGRGGYTYSNDTDDPRTGGINNGNWGTSDNRRVQGGLAGRPIDYSTGSLLFLGGGGGCGDHENGFGGAAGDGGGIIYFASYGTVSGAGQIISAGATAANTNTSTSAPNNVRGREGASGGGGGGAIVVNSTGLVSGITITASGGNGGNNAMVNQMVTAAKMAYGPGGGGGGGYIGVPAGTTATINVAGGNNGIVIYTGGTNTCQIDDIFPPNGATKGGAGQTNNITSFSIATTGATICAGNSAVITASINGTAPGGTTLNWYTASTGGSPVATGTTYTTATLSTTTTYYVGTCPGIYREPVTVTVTSAPAAPAASSPVSYCLNTTASQLSATAGGGNTLLWWGTASSGGTSSGTAPTPSTSAVGSTTYYVSQTNGSCEGPRQAIVVNILALPNQPAVTTPVDYCLNATASQLSATAGGGNSLLWWGTASAGGTSSGTAPTPSTASAGSTTYYVSETNGTCESSRAPIVVNVNALPLPPSVADTISYCQNEAATPLTPSGATINWYNTATGGSPIATPTPNTSTVGVTTYYVSQTQSGCESNRDSIKVVVNTSFTPPTVTNATYCLGDAASDLSGNASGTGTLNWYTVPSGGTGSTTAPTPSTATAGTTSYYVSQGSATCESSRSQVDVIVNALPNPPAVTTPVDYCLNAPASQLSATQGAGNTLLWWGTASTGGASSGIAPTPSTATAGTTTYYVSQNDGACESARAPIVVNVNALPSPPTVADTISYCQNEAATPLTPSGAGINWYANATGGSPIATPTPNTSTVGVTTYYVSQTQSGCESDRDSIKVVINTSFLPPSVTNASYCVGDPASDLSPNVSGTATINWYTVSSGGTGSTTAPTPSTSAAGTTTYYVSQGSATCESSRAQLDVVVNALPLAPTVTSPVDYCQNATASQLSATASGSNSLLWWGTSATGGTSSGTATTPSTSTVGSTAYYVSETDGTCQSTRTVITVNINAIPAPPSVADTISYCQNETATPLTAGGAGINWYPTATGGSPTPAPTPNTSTVGVITYYVSQTQSGCESNRDSIKVVINTTFLPPTVSNAAYCLGATAADLSGNANGTATLNWYITSTGGTGSTTAPTPSTSSVGTVSYYVSQGSTTCESNRAQIDVTVNPNPATPSGIDVTYCINETAVPLTATGIGTLTWFTVPTGGAGSATAPTPSTSTVGTVFYYVSQTDANGCESGRDNVQVDVINLQSAPLAVNPAYCLGASASPLSAGGTTTLNWWGTAATGGTSSATAPTPSTGTVGTTTYYVSQGTGACESPRTAVVVTVNALPNSSFTSDATSGCAPACITFMGTALNGSTFSWNFGDGGTGSQQNASHCYPTPGTYAVSLVATSAQGCSDSVTVASAVTVNSLANAQIAVSPGTIVEPNTPVTFSASAAITQAYNWYFADPVSGTQNTSTLQNPSHTFAEEGTYCVQLLTSTPAGCSDTSIACIEVIKEASVVIPNVITPNGDGVNEHFIVTASGVKTLEASIYDRWGIKLYSWSGISGGWDGKGKAGKTVSNGVYYYLITTSDFKGETKDYSGYVQVIGVE